MAHKMNRKEWLKSAGTVMAGGLGFAALPIGLLNGRSKMNKPLRPITSPRRFISDEEFGRQMMPPEIKARLFANENPFGPSEKAKQAIRDSIDGSYRYAMREIGMLSGKIAEYEQLPSENLMFAAGSSPLLLAASLHFSQLGNIVTGEPSYADLPESAESFGAEVRWIPVNDEYKLDLQAMEAAVDENTSLIYICNPNNPTGTSLEAGELESFCKRVSEKTPVFIDEAYIDYLDEPDKNSMIHLVKEGYNVMIARTFSKLYGFAGLRVGYLVASEEMIETLAPYTPGPFSISATSLAAAAATYMDEEYMSDAKAKSAASKDFLLQTLKQEGYSPIPSDTNFVLFPIHMDGERFIMEMRKRGVGIRSWAFEGKTWCRVSIGKMEEMAFFADAFTQIS
ncbi:pyridoxal phosphate-dependent aminotransferase [Rhodohalobacter sp. 614A]|uniref:pyridoxal phosphate-dependent aminotransferase n=1 Tax=Rhodohalobacter sp. 614A TaxID=2908649 RepID=UPI001F396282|nr:histidinol-phosphate transaminase [Rhodohalobacter sp. 614A]